MLVVAKDEVRLTNRSLPALEGCAETRTPSWGMIAVLNVPTALRKGESHDSCGGYSSSMGRRRKSEPSPCLDEGKTQPKYRPSRAFQRNRPPKLVGQQADQLQT